MADVFLSYARKERAQAERVKAGLEVLGLTVFFDVDGLDGGDVFPDVLDREVKTAGTVISLWSPYSLTRPWVKTECRIGKDRGVLIPAAIAPLDPLHDVPAAFYDLQTIDLTDYSGDPAHPEWRKLVKSLARTLKRPTLLEAEAKAAERRAESTLSAAAAEDAARLRAEMEALKAELAVLRSTRPIVGDVYGSTEGSDGASRRPSASSDPEVQQARLPSTEVISTSTRSVETVVNRLRRPSDLQLGIMLMTAALLSLTAWLVGPLTLFFLNNSWRLPGAPVVNDLPFKVGLPDLLAFVFQVAGGAFLSRWAGRGKSLHVKEMIFLSAFTSVSLAYVTALFVQPLAPNVPDFVFHALNVFQVASMATMALFAGRAAARA